MKFYIFLGQKILRNFTYLWDRGSNRQFEVEPLAFSTNAISVWFHGILKDSRTSDVIHNTVTSASGVALVVSSSVGVPLCDAVCAMTSLTMSSLLTSLVMGDDDSVLSASDAMQAETGGSIALEVVKLGYVT